MRGIPISSIGAKVSYAIETSSGIRPTTGYREIPDISSVPEIDSEPDTIETTTLQNARFRTYINGLQDTGGSIAMTANFTNLLYEVWTEFVASYEAGKKDDKEAWLCIDIPDFDLAAYMPVNPSPIGIPALDTNSLIEKDVYVTPTGEPIWAEKPTAYATVYAAPDSEIRTAKTTI